MPESLFGVVVVVVVAECVKSLRKKICCELFQASSTQTNFTESASLKGVRAMAGNGRTAYIIFQSNDLKNRRLSMEDFLFSGRMTFLNFGR